MFRLQEVLTKHIVINVPTESGWNKLYTSSHCFIPSTAESSTGIVFLREGTELPPAPFL